MVIPEFSFMFNTLSVGDWVFFAVVILLSIASGIIIFYLARTVVGPVGRTITGAIIVLGLGGLIAAAFLGTGANKFYDTMDREVTAYYWVDKPNVNVDVRRAMNYPGRFIPAGQLFTENEDGNLVRQTLVGQFNPDTREYRLFIPMDEGTTYEELTPAE